MSLTSVNSNAAKCWISETFLNVTGDSVTLVPMGSILSYTIHAAQIHGSSKTRTVQNTGTVDLHWRVLMWQRRQQAINNTTLHWNCKYSHPYISYKCHIRSHPFLVSTQWNSLPRHMTRHCRPTTSIVILTLFCWPTKSGCVSTVPTLSADMSTAKMTTDIVGRHFWRQWRPIMTGHVSWA